ncbi:hypothetical protein BBK82_03165 [Lentzea guizhouensis]|uniref:Uncharacterized protein n=1 Tax=Lentzea guizhouensis TaxID=1586287 RepID=A0A1B2HBW3_9PSEU|nr:hypothetical protein [Lentzea guizhouensis]ANZ35217.1 hypothetical protein BBK82_03165 [Lentzea guizhouensis]
MSSDEQRKAGEDFAAALGEAAKKLQQGLENTGHILTAQGAMGWVYRGDLPKARQALGKLPVDKLAELSAVAAALSSLADEVAAAKS